MAKTAALSLRIEPELKEALERAAASERRPLANYVELLLADYAAGPSAKEVVETIRALVHAVGQGSAVPNEIQRMALDKAKSILARLPVTR